MQSKFFDVQEWDRAIEAKVPTCKTELDYLQMQIGETIKHFARKSEEVDSENWRRLNVRLDHVDRMLQQLINLYASAQIEAAAQDATA